MCCMVKKWIFPLLIGVCLINTSMAQENPILLFPKGAPGETIKFIIDIGDCKPDAKAGADGPPDTAPSPDRAKPIGEGNAYQPKTSDAYCHWEQGIASSP